MLATLVEVEIFEVKRTEEVPVLYPISRCFLNPDFVASIEPVLRTEPFALRLFSKVIMASGYDYIIGGSMEVAIRRLNLLVRPS